MLTAVTRSIPLQTLRWWFYRFLIRYGILIHAGDVRLNTVKLLTNYNQFNQDLKDINNEIHILLSHLIAIKDNISLIELRNTVVEMMKAIVNASDYTRTFLAKSKIGE